MCNWNTFRRREYPSLQRLLDRVETKCQLCIRVELNHVSGNSWSEDRDQGNPKKIFTQELEGTRRKGRPRKGWRQEVERDFQVLGVRRWRELGDREKWTGIIRQAKAHSGL